ncbi:unnamed protein product [Pylaiella littoralis]
MGKFRGHQDKSRRGREKKLLKKKAAGGGGRPVQADTAVSGSPGGQQQRQKAAAGVGVGTGVKKKIRHVTYAKEHSVLICGDGDFSFTRGVIRHRGTGAGVVATSLDSRKTVLKKYPRAETWLAKLDADGAQVVHAVDATRLEETLLGSGGGRAAGDGSGDGVGQGKKRVLFDRVVFNFPHTGKQRTHLNRNLIRDFFASTKGLVKSASQGGEVHVTLKDKPPYSGWNVKAMAKESELILVRCLTFDPSVFPGYRHSTTDPQAKEFDAGGARTNVFCRARSALDDDVDESGVFPVIVQTGTVSGDGQLTSADDTGSGQTADDDGKDSDGDLFGKGESWASDGGVMGSDDNSGEESDGGDSGGSGGGPAAADSAASGGGGKGHARKKNKTSRRDGLLKVSASETEEGHAGDVGKGPGKKESGILKQGMLQPPLKKKKAAKRRAQRKKKAAAAKEAAASAATSTAPGVSQGTTSSSIVGGKAKSPKRKRGKYVVGSANKVPPNGQE